MDVDVAGTSSAPTVLLLVGSPRHGLTEALARHVAVGVAQGGAFATWFSLASSRVAGCIECDACLRVPRDCVLNGSPHDEMATLDDLLNGCDLLAVMTPVFFAGPPSQLKAVYDRFQPRWARRYVHGEAARPKRPASLFIVGGGADPYGFDPLITISKSALAIAGFRVEQVESLIGSAPSRSVTAPQSSASADSVDREDSHTLPNALVDRAVAFGEDLARRAIQSREDRA